MGFLVKSGSMLPFSTGKCVSLDFGDRPLYGVLVKSGSRILLVPESVCAILEFGTSAPLLVFWSSRDLEFPLAPACALASSLVPVPYIGFW